MTPSTKENAVAVLMMIFISLLCYVILSCITGCAHPQVVPSSLSLSVTHTKQAILRAEASAAAIHPRDPATSSAISDLREQLSEAGASFDATTAKVQWYETDWQRLKSANDSLTKENSTLHFSLHQTAKERDFYPFILGIVSALLCAVAFGSWALKLPGLLGFIAPPAIILGGGIFGFSMSRMLAAWGSKLIP